MTKLHRILKSRDIALSTKVHLVQVMVFPVVMNGCESWTIKKAEHWRIDAFELWHWRRLLRVPWTARRSNQSILKEISPEYPLEGLMLKQKLILWPPDAKSQLIGKDTDAGGRLRAGREGGDREWDGWMASLTQWTWVLANSRRWWRTRKPGMLQSMGLKRVRHDWATEQQQKSMNTVVVGSKLKTQKSLALQYTNNEKSGREIKETIQFTTTTKRIKC